MPVTILLKAIGLNAGIDPRELLRLRQLPPDGLAARRWSSSPSACAAKSRASTSPTRPARSSSQKDKRITARHMRELGAVGHHAHLACPKTTSSAACVARNIVDADTGEILAKANDELTEALLKKLRAAGVQGHPGALHQRARPRRVHLADAAHRRDRRRVRRARRHLPHDAPRRAADRRRGAGAVPAPVLQRRTRYDLSRVGRMKFNASVGRDEPKAR